MYIHKYSVKFNKVIFKCQYNNKYVILYDLYHLPRTNTVVYIIL